MKHVDYLCLGICMKRNPVSKGAGICDVSAAEP